MNMRATEEGYVYFLRPVGEDGPVKIGASRWPDHRLETYLAWSPVALEIAAIMPGTQALERRFHAKFYHLHSHHEWFHEGPELLRCIEDVKAGRFDISTLPKGRNIHRGGEAAEMRAKELVGARTRLWWMRKRGEPIPKDVAAALDHDWTDSREQREAKHDVLLAWAAASRFEAA